MGKRRHLYIPGYENKAGTNGTANSRPGETRSAPRTTNPRIEIRDEEQPTYVQPYENQQYKIHMKTNGSTILVLMKN